MARRKGFTLVELLVVIAVIVTLISLILPAINQAKLAAKQTVCATHVHTWALVLTNYSSDNRGLFPTRYGAWTNIPQAIWFRLTTPYLRAEPRPSATSHRPLSFYFCPESAVDSRYRQAFIDAPAPAFDSTGGGRGSLEYTIWGGMPYLPSDPDMASAPIPPARIDDTTDQHGRRKVLVADASRWSVKPTTASNGTPIHTTHESPGKPHYKHVSAAITGLVYQMGIPRGMNVAYIDGSVRWNKWERMDFNKSHGIPGDISLLWDQDY